MTTSDLLARVMKQWSPPAFYTLAEVRNGTGYGPREGRADVLAMSVWPSRGIELVGAELKVSRSDWLRELKSPAKSECFIQFCHRWYLISAPDVAKECEIPKTWGWMCAGPNGLKTVKAAPELTPTPPDFMLLASIFRKIGEPMQNMVSVNEMERLALEQANRMRESDREGITSMKKAFDEANTRYQELVRQVNQFECASGMSLRGWKDDPDWTAKGLMLRQYMQSGFKTISNELQNFVARMEGLAAWGRGALQEQDAAEKRAAESLKPQPVSQ